MFSNRSLLSGLVLVALVFTACGKKGEPEPPIRLLPAKASDLQARQQGSDAVLRVGYPKTAVNGMALPGLENVEVWWMPRPATPDGEAPDVRESEFRGAAKRLLTLSGSDLQSATAGDRIFTRMPLPEQSADNVIAHVWAVVFTSSEGERSDFSNLAAMVAVPPPVAPVGLEVTGKADGVEILWEKSSDEPAQYRVYRRRSSERAYGAPLARSATNRHLDETAVFGERYIYSVTALGEGRPPIESATAAEAEIEYLDYFAPPSPDGLVALAEPARVRLRWRAGTVGDLAGYHVYRRASGEAEFRRLSTAVVVPVEYLDAGLEPGRSYAYRVTAVDENGNESEPSATVTTEVR